MELRRAGAIAIGGIVGASLRWSIGEMWGESAQWPWPVFVANVVGCAVLGWLVGRFGPLAASTGFLAATVGFCGALTTFSAFAVDVALFADDGRWATAAAYFAGSVVLGVAAYVGARELGGPHRLVQR